MPEWVNIYLIYMQLSNAQPENCCDQSMNYVDIWKQRCFSERQWRFAKNNKEQNNVISIDVIFVQRLDSTYRTAVYIRLIMSQWITYINAAISLPRLTAWMNNRIRVFMRDVIIHQRLNLNSGWNYTDVEVRARMCNFISLKPIEVITNRCPYLS